MIIAEEHNRVDLLKLETAKSGAGLHRNQLPGFIDKAYLSCGIGAFLTSGL